MGNLGRGWISVIIPLSAIGSGFSVLIPIYILSLNGNVFDISIATTFYAFVGIPASLLWGELINKTEKIKRFVLVTSIGTFAILLLLYVYKTVLSTEIIYGIFALVATAASPAIDILLMGRKRNPSLPRFLSIFSLLSISGTLIGYLGGAFLDGDLIKMYIIFLAGLNAIALLLTFIFVKDPYIKTKEMKAIKEVNKSFPLLNSISRLPSLLTGYRLIRAISASFRSKRSRDISLLITSISLFNLGMYLFNTSYVPYLSKYGVSFGSIFLINAVNSVGQMLIYGVFLVAISGIDLFVLYRFSTFFRSVSYVVAIVPIFVFTLDLLQINIVVYMLAGFAYAMWNVASSVILYNRIPRSSAGHTIGIWLAIMGTSAVAGSLLSGFISSSLGYSFTFMAAIAINLASLAVFSIAASELKT